MGSDAPTVASGRPLVVSVCSAILPDRLPRVSVCVCVCVRARKRERSQQGVCGCGCGCVCVRLYEKERERSQEEGVSNPSSAIYLVIDLG